MQMLSSTGEQARALNERGGLQMSERRYRAPSSIVRVFNNFSAKVGFGSQLTVAGRKSGQPRTVVVTPIEVDGAEYLVSPRGQSDWVLNLRAAGGKGTLKAKKTSREITAIEVDGTEREKALEVYQEKLGPAVSSHFKAMPDAADHPVFRVS